MELTVYLHRTRKKNFAICETYKLDIDLDNIKWPEDKVDDLDFLNKKLRDDSIKSALKTTSVKKYGTGYVSFMRPQYEGPEESNGNDKFYFDNTSMQFKIREVSM